MSIITLTLVFQLTMHGSHFLKDEYEISSSRTGPPKKSTESFKFPSSKTKGKSSPAAKKLSFWIILSRTILAVTLLVLGLIRSIGVPRLIKSVAISQVLIAAYIIPNLMIFKRSPNINQKIMEILPTPFNLIISFDDSKNETIYENIPITYLINHSNFSLSLFEGIAFSWCDSYLKNKRYPTKLTIVASSQVKSCVMGQYRWSLKLPKSLIDFQASNSTSNNFTCPMKQKDPFDCEKKDLEGTRLKYSQLCPDMSPILLACTNRIALEKAISYNPPWSSNK